MGFDWITWGIWGLGLAILIIWIIQPIREFRGIFRAKRKMLSDKNRGSVRALRNGISSYQ